MCRHIVKRQKRRLGCRLRALVATEEFRWGVSLVLLCLWPLPFVEVALLLHMLLDVVGQGGEEVDTSNAFNLVNGVDVSSTWVRCTSGSCI